MPPTFEIMLPALLGSQVPGMRVLAESIGLDQQAGAPDRVSGEGEPHVASVLPPTATHDEHLQTRHGETCLDDAPADNAFQWALRSGIRISRRLDDTLKTAASLRGQHSLSQQGPSHIRRDAQALRDSERSIESHEGEGKIQAPPEIQGGLKGICDAAAMRTFDNEICTHLPSPHGLVRTATTP